MDDSRYVSSEYTWRQKDSFRIGPGHVAIIKTAGATNGGYFSNLGIPYPLEAIWLDFCERSEESASPTSTTANAKAGPSRQHNELAIDCAERMARDAAGWQDEFGAIIDPYLEYESSTCTPRYVGLTGQLIGSDRCEDLLDSCVLGYENCLSTLRNPQIHPEFAFKELLLAHRALAPLVERSRLETWRRYWRACNSRAAFNCVQTDVPANSKTFALIGEQLRLDADLGGDIELVDELLESELSRIDAYGMYHDPKCPLTYHAVVLQQLGMLVLSGYDGKFRAQLETAVRRGAVTSLFMQSVTGQAPFGGRSNQFHHTEAQNAALFEEAAAIALRDGDTQAASIFRGAAGASIRCIAPWILETSPWRHIKQGFHPDLNHGTDSSGPYSVYGILTGSLLCIANAYAPEVEIGVPPAELGGYAFEIDPCFAKVFATADGWSLEVDERATVGKDATGLGRIQHRSLRSEAILSGPVPAQPEYSFAFRLPQENLAICPVWGKANAIEDHLYSHRLADYSVEIESFDFRPATESWPHEPTEETGSLQFEVERCGKFGGVERIVEKIEIASACVSYRAFLHPHQPTWGYIIPVILTDGQESSRIELPGSSHDTLRVTYRDATFEIVVFGGHFLETDEVDTNKNGRYRAILVIPDTTNMTVSWRIPTHGA